MTTKQRLRKFLRILFVLLLLGGGILILSVSIRFVSKETRTQPKAADSLQAELHFSSLSFFALKDASFTVGTLLRANGLHVIGYNMRLIYDPNILDLTAIRKTKNPSDVFSAHIPMKPDGGFAFNTVIENSKTNGQIDFGAVAYDFTTSKRTGIEWRSPVELESFVFTPKTTVASGTVTKVRFVFDGSTKTSAVLAVQNNQLENVLAAPTDEVVVTIQ